MKVILKNSNLVFSSQNKEEMSCLNDILLSVESIYGAFNVGDYGVFIPTYFVENRKITRLKIFAYTAGDVQICKTAVDYGVSYSSLPSVTNLMSITLNKGWNDVVLSTPIVLNSGETIGTKTKNIIGYISRTNSEIENCVDYFECAMSIKQNTDNTYYASAESAYLLMIPFAEDIIKPTDLIAVNAELLTKIRTDGVGNTNVVESRTPIYLNPSNFNVGDKIYELYILSSQNTSIIHLYQGKNVGTEQYNGSRLGSVSIANATTVNWVRLRLRKPISITEFGDSIGSHSSGICVFADKESGIDSGMYASLSNLANWTSDRVFGVVPMVKR